jgi:hypothetical protein
MKLAKIALTVATAAAFFLAVGCAQQTPPPAPAPAPVKHAPAKAKHHAKSYHSKLGTVSTKKDTKK